MAKTNGYILWEGPSPYNGDPIAMIATMRSRNQKTGDMSQVWIIPRDVAPHESLKDGSDAAVCGPCPLRGDGTGKGRACYVTLVQGPLSVWKTYKRSERNAPPWIVAARKIEKAGRRVLRLKPKRGGYIDATEWDDADVATLFAGLFVRLGAWGDPAMLPLHRVEAVVSLAKGWTGYTHQWPTVDPAWSGYLMASADNVAQRAAARAKGYRSFALVPAGQDVQGVTGAMECAATRDRNPLQCRECLACGGTRRGTVPNAVDVVIAAHGAGAKYVAD